MRMDWVEAGVAVYREEGFVVEIGDLGKRGVGAGVVAVIVVLVVVVVGKKWFVLQDRMLDPSICGVRVVEAAQVKIATQKMVRKQDLNCLCCGCS